MCRRGSSPCRIRSLDAPHAVDQCCLTSSIRPVDLLGSRRVVDTGMTEGAKADRQVEPVANRACMGEFDGQLGTVAVHLVGDDRQRGHVTVTHDERQP